MPHTYDVEYDYEHSYNDGYMTVYDPETLQPKRVLRSEFEKRIYAAQQKREDSLKSAVGKIQELNKEHYGSGGGASGNIVVTLSTEDCYRTSSYDNYDYEPIKEPKSDKQQKKSDERLILKHLDTPIVNFDDNNKDSLFFNGKINE